jgi:hypothetical protein
MEQAFSRFPHLSEAIFNSLDDKSLAGCKEASRYWYVYLDVQKFLETRIIKAYIKNVEEAVVIVKKIYFESRCRQQKEMKTRKTEKDARFKIQLFNARSKIENFLSWYDKKEFDMVFYDCLSNCAINCLDIQTYIHKLDIDYGRMVRTSMSQPVYSEKPKLHIWIPHESRVAKPLVTRGVNHQPKHNYQP